MNITDRMRSFLEAATTGLKDDRELQMETRSELASHVEAASRDLITGGLPEEQAAEERDLVRRDTTISLGSFSAGETRLVQRLKQETLDAVQSLNMTEQPVGTEPASDTPAR